MTQSQLGEISFEGSYYPKMNEISLKEKFAKIKIPYSREQEHVLLFRKSDFLFFKVSNSNMPQFFFRNKTFLFAVRSLRYSGYLTNTSCVCQVAAISKRSNG